MFRFQFSLRTLFIVVTAICIWLGWQVHAIRHRQEVWAWILDHQWSMFEADTDSLPWYRRMMGDRELKNVLAINATADERDKIQEAFPEASILGW